MKRLTLAAGAALAARAALRAARADDLTGRTALVTGGSRGLGFALAQELAAAGARVAICARGEDALERARQRLAAGGAEVLATRCDVADRSDVDAWVAEATERFGRVDVLVNNAGVISVGPLRSQRPDDFARAMDIHFWGIVNTVYAVLPQFLERGEGTIANVTSIGGKVSVPLLGSYTPSKYAAVGLSQGLHAELARHGVHVVTVVPGLMRTGSYLSALFKGDAELLYSLFAPVAASPLNTIAADRAARRIVRAIRHRETEVTLTLHAKLLARATGLAPGLVTEALALVNRVLPDSNDPRLVRGDRIDSPVDDSIVTALGRRAARATNQPPD
ncbi:MAG TPA: SDR family NAD(P)-dependent oxidoreductase [Gaiellaceae bacterium]|nr:SDR family NAD(P)-dependent oxidoreductase [Gaiellaceae bacterium]